MREKLKNYSRIIFMLSFAIMFFPLNLSIKTIVLLIFLMALNFCPIYMAAYGVIIYITILSIYCWQIVDINIFSSYLIINKLYLFIIFIALFLVNILIVIFRLSKYKMQEKKNYNKRFKYYISLITFKIRFIYPILAFLFVVYTVINSFAGLYYSYENRYFGYYFNEQFLDNHDNDVKIEEVKDSRNNTKSYIFTKFDRKGNIKNKYNVDIWRSPDITDGIDDDKVFIDEYDKDGNHISLNVIERGFKNSNDKYNILDRGDVIYFSSFTFFTVGYGDITPIAQPIKNIVLIEMFMGYFITCIFVPILIISIQKLFQDSASETSKSDKDNIDSILKRTFTVHIKKINN